MFQIVINLYVVVIGIQTLIAVLHRLNIDVILCLDIIW